MKADIGAGCGESPLPRLDWRTLQAAQRFKLDSLLVFTLTGWIGFWDKNPSPDIGTAIKPANLNPGHTLSGPACFRAPTGFRIPPEERTTTATAPTWSTLLRQAPPFRQAIWFHAIPRRNLFHRHTGNQRLSHNPALHIIRPTPVPFGPDNTPTKPQPKRISWRSPMELSEKIILNTRSQITRGYGKWGQNTVYAPLATTAAFGDAPRVAVRPRLPGPAVSTWPDFGG